jgi:Ca2+/Na+ antiporter
MITSTDARKKTQNEDKQNKVFCVVFFVLFVFILCFVFSVICTGNLLSFCFVFFVLVVFILCFVFSNEDKQNKEHNTENLKDYQYRYQEIQNTEWRQTKQRTQYRKLKDYQYRCQKKQSTEWRQPKQRTQNRFCVLYFLVSVLVIF